MNHAKVYSMLIENALNRSITEGVYYESHHIVPKCLGGSDDKGNKVKLTYREHFVAHRLLHRIYPEHLGLLHSVKIMLLQSPGRLNSGYVPDVYIIKECDAIILRKYKYKHKSSQKMDRNLKLYLDGCKLRGVEPGC